MRKNKLLLLAIISLTICSCSFSIPINPRPMSSRDASSAISESFSDPLLSSSLNNESSLSINSSKNNSSNSSSKNSSSAPSSMSSQKSSSPASSKSSSKAPTIYTKELSISTIMEFPHDYSTGNYGSITYDGTTYDYYRTTGIEYATVIPYLLRLFDVHYPYADGGLPGCFSNNINSPINGIQSIKIRYRSQGMLRVTCYADFINFYTIELSSSEYYTDATVRPDFDTGFFMICTNGADVDISEIVISYTNEGDYHMDLATSTGDRIAFESYSGSLEDGVTTHDMHISKTETKTYTYYSKDYCYSNYDTINKSEAFLTDPVDVCNYYLAFKEFPANYVTSDEKETYGAKFGSYARQVSTYHRTDGYATAVPYNNQPGQTAPLYYELDIALNNSYSLNSRGVGRVVAWKYGFSCYSDPLEEIPVCLYTDDHYATFMEYNCRGSFLNRFNGEMARTHYIYSPAYLF